MAGDRRSRLGLRYLHLAEELSILLEGWYSVVLWLSGVPARVGLYYFVDVSWKWSQTMILFASQV